MKNTESKSKRRGGRPRTSKKMSPTMKFLLVNKPFFPGGVDEGRNAMSSNWRKIKNVGGFNWGMF